MEQPRLWKRLLNKLQQRFTPAENSSEIRVRRRRAIISALTRQLLWMKVGLFCVGYLWMVIVPSSQLGRGTYIDENALQPGQVNTYWDWGDVHTADNYLNQLEGLRDTSFTSEQRAQYIMNEFRKLGLSASTQNYMFSANTGVTKGTNAYAILSSPRTSGTEAMVISASWLSRTDEGNGTLNLRGVATILALANFLKRYSLWAKDIVFVVSDGYLEGMQAWLSAYHGSSQTNLRVEPLELSSGVIWTALNIDYPGHSFSHIGIFYEGVNGRLPNQDLLNSFQRISTYTGGVPVVLYDSISLPEEQDGLGTASWVPSAIRKHTETQAFLYQARNFVRHLGYQARGRPSGVHGLFHQHRIDAVTVYAIPATGPHGFHAIGRIIESTLRTTNNLLERLHASFFFYILTGPDRFLKIGNYLPSAVLFSVALMLGGLRAWVDAGWTHIDGAQSDKQNSDTHRVSKKKWSRRRRPVIKVLGIMTLTHSLGAFLFSLITRSWFIRNITVLSPILFTLLATAPLITLVIAQSHQDSLSPLSAVLKALNLCFTSTVISIITVLNFSLAAFLAISLGIPLSLSSPSHSFSIRVTKYSGYVLLGIGWLLFGQAEMRKAIRDWEILSVWFLPFICMVYVPLVLQAGLVCILPL